MGAKLKPIEKAIGARFRERRIAVRGSQDQVGDAIGVTRQQVDKVEKGRNRIGAGELVLALQSINVRPSEFFAAFDDPDAGEPAQFSAGAVKAAAAFDQLPKRQQAGALQMIRNLAKLKEDT